MGLQLRESKKYITLISVVSIDQSREWDRNEKEPLVIYNVVVLFHKPQLMCT